MAPRNPRSRAVPRSAAPALLAVVALLAGLMGGAAAIDCLGCTTASCYCSKIGTSSPLANPFDTSCANYLQCANGVAYVTNCPTGLAWNDRAKNCDWAANKMCEGCTGTTTTVTPPPSDTTTPPSTGTTTPPSTGTTTPPSTGTTTACNGCSDAACFCTKVPVGDYANPFDANCASYIKCYNGGGQLNPCPAGTVYDPALKICNWPSATNPCKPACTTGTSTPPTNPTTPPTTPPITTPPPPPTPPTTPPTTTPSSTGAVLYTSAPSAQATYYFDIQTACPHDTNGYAETDGYPACSSWNPAFYETLRKVNSNNVVAIDRNVLSANRAALCGKKVIVRRRDGSIVTPPDGGDFFVWDGCEACVGGAKVDFSVSGARAIAADACTQGLINGVSIQVVDTVVKPFVP